MAGRNLAVIEPDGSTALATVPTHAVQIGTLHADSPTAIIEAATAIANPLADLIRAKGLAKRISGRDYVVCEGWTTLAIMLGVTPHEVDVVERDGIYTATVELRTLADGKALARASAECGADDEVWGKRPRYARRSMALTRATGKACRMAFSWIMILAGYAATPAEEMVDEDDVGPPAPRAAAQQRTAKKDRASTGQVDEIRMLLTAEQIPADVCDKMNARLAGGISAAKADEAIERLKNIIRVALEAEAVPDEPEPAKATQNKALDELRKLYRKAIDDYAGHLASDDDERDAFEERIAGRTSKQDWTTNNFKAAIKALEAGEVELPAEDPDEAA